MRSHTFARPASERVLSLTLVVGLHVAAVLALLAVAQPVIKQIFPSTVQIELVKADAPKPEIQAPEPPKPLPLQPRVVKPQPRPTPPRPTPAPIMQTEAPAPANTPVISAAPPPKELPPAAPVEAAAPKVEAVQAPRHDADHLHNPKPPYPRASISLGEEGTVWLRVQVNEEGRPLQVLVDQSSGFPRLDRSARDTVASSYRFVPARQGERTVVGWVRFPIQFKLDN